MEKFGLSEEKINKLLNLFKSHKEIEKVIIYGSRVKGNYNKWSDVDITLVGEQVTKEIMNKLFFEIDDLLLPYFFDISCYSKISNPDVIDHIDRVGQILYERENI